MSKGLPTRRVKWVSDAMLCQVKLFMSEDCPAQVGTNNEDHLQSKRSLQPNGMSFDDLPPGFGGNGYSDTLNQTHIPRMKWKRPPTFVLNSGWHVVAGEQSEEREAQICREMRVLEAVYPRVSAIPPSPLVSPELENCNYDDTKTPIIPVIPIEEEDATLNEAPPCTSSAATCPVYNVPFDSKAMVVEKSNGAPTCLEADVAAAASAAFAAILQSNEEGSMVDPDLLIKLLSDPKLIDTLSKNSASTATNMATHISETKPVTTSVSLPASHLSESKKLLNEASNMHNVHEKLRPGSDTWLTSQPFHGSSISRPSAKSCTIPSLERALDNSNQIVKYLQPPSTASTRVSETPHAISSKLAEVNNLLQSLISPRAASSSGSILTNTPAVCASSQGTIYSGKPVVDRLEITGREMPTLSSRPLVSNAASSALFSHIDSSQPLFRSTDAYSPRTGDLFMTHRSDMASPSIPANLSLPTETHLFRSSLQSPSPPPDLLPTPPLSSVRTPAVKDANYYMNLIRQHGTERNETRENTPQYQSGAPKLTAVSGQVHARPKAQKPCKYFNSSKGCRNGSNCPFEHNTVNLPDSDRSKRFKFSSDY